MDKIYRLSEFGCNAYGDTEDSIAMFSELDSNKLRDVLEVMNPHINLLDYEVDIFLKAANELFDCGINNTMSGHFSYSLEVFADGIINKKLRGE